jgi:hypothetical protein
MILSTRPKFKGGDAIFCAFPSSFFVKFFQRRDAGGVVVLTTRAFFFVERRKGAASAANRVFSREKGKKRDAGASKTGRPALYLIKTIITSTRGFPGDGFNSRFDVARLRGVGLSERRWTVGRIRLCHY